MTCPITVRLGVYALGAADPAERILIESHLTTCQHCRAELAQLEPLPALLARVPANLLLPADPSPARRPAPAPAAPGSPAGNTRARPGRWRTAAGAAAAAAVLGTAAGLWLARPAATRNTATSPPAPITLSGANPVTHVHITVTLTATSWGTSIRLLASGLPLNQPCQLIVRSRTGATEIAGAWDAWQAGPVTIPASAAWRPADISSLQVATPKQNLVTITATRPSAHIPPSSLPTG